jgi:acetylornithine deacetylase/succinyl-diaminopimelate desuccinylase-like protein
MDTPWEHPIVQTMVRAHEQAAGVTVPPPSHEHPVNFGAASDGSFLEDEGVPAICFGPGTIRLAHSKDEHVELDEIVVAARSLAGCVLEWCGVAA